MDLIKNILKAVPPRIVLISETVTFSLLPSPLSPSLCLSWFMLTTSKLCFKISTYKMWGHLHAHEWLAPLPSVSAPHWEY